MGIPPNNRSSCGINHIREPRCRILLFHLWYLPDLPYYNHYDCSKIITVNDHTGISPKTAATVMIGNSSYHVILVTSRPLLLLVWFNGDDNHFSPMTMLQKLPEFIPGPHMPQICTAMRCHSNPA